ncbi:M23 family metallopeptidase [Sphingobium indicum]|uniref:Peptidase M23 n=2 Tax=Sphingobium indicum TaxID=332055 RepID=A0A1L5BQ85_SPHIB|nr:M23 family metallopeptidase [Sphingobium indicum]APL94937.1 peptidase M23 [Sphingobium indicum B90A]KEY98001.1 peptidase M23 [Sphingomonas sp. BHC-A]NYI23056.1 murein DD-endopeptidase MepM/ murein hydrolase activator NlpD [Sphingobium indicum]RYM01864.1 M23 family metallopeptidase [Sphingobium indicum]
MGAAALWAGMTARCSKLCPDREIFLRSGGQVKFIHISRRAQLAAVGLLSSALVGGIGFGLSVAASSAEIEQERAALAARDKAISSSASQVARYRKSVDQLAQELQERQDFMDDLYRTHFGQDGTAPAGDVVGKVDGGTKGGTSKLDTKISVAPEAAPLLRIDARQRRFAALLTGAVQKRADKAAAAIRSFGLNPDSLARSAARAQNRAMGGPFVPWEGQDVLPGEFEKLAKALSRMEFLEASLLAIPSGKPTATPMMSSSYGYRSDPFNGHAAFHAGLDFPGSMGQPILAAASGKVSFVGQRSGYGNVIEVTHGNGILTRYAHLSGFSARVGQQVARGDAIARMGSTGRSTGPHLHFEVRVNGNAINPRRFLEARKDVLQIQQIATARLADVGDRG